MRAALSLSAELTCTSTTAEDLNSSNRRSLSASWTGPAAARVSVTAWASNVVMIALMGPSLRRPETGVNPRSWPSPRQGCLTLHRDVDSVEVVPDRLVESYDRLFLALEHRLAEAQRVNDVGVREWASLAMLDAIDLAEELGVMWDDEAARCAREAFGDLDQQQHAWPLGSLQRVQPRRCLRLPGGVIARRERQLGMDNLAAELQSSAVGCMRIERGCSE
jgi:hypothetical protein